MKKARWREICTAHYCLSKKGGRNKHESTHTFSYKSKKSARINHIFFSIATYGERGNRVEWGLGKKQTALNIPYVIDEAWKP